MKHWKLILVILLVVAGVASAGKWYSNRDTQQGSPFRTTKADRRDIIATISATGTIEPEEVVDIGAQVTGQIVSFGTDIDGKSIDYGSKLKGDQLIAKIDDTLYQADLASAQAQVESAKAGVTRAEADLAQAQAKMYQSNRNWERAKNLGPSDALSQVDYDQYQSDYEVAKANVGVSDAAVAQAKTAVTQAQATLKRADQNIKYCTILAPVDGTVIARRVNVGQTVVSNLSASSLFLMAKDLRKMELWVPVNEADIGAIKSGQPTAFSCDTFPNEIFRGVVDKVRLNATTTSNVVTYTVEVTIDNSAGRLLPYLSANVTFETDRRDHVLSVPNTALRWAPRDDQTSLETKNQMAEWSKPQGSGDASGEHAASSTDANTPAAAKPAGGDEPTSRPAGAGGRRQHSGAGGGRASSPGTRSAGTVWVADGTLAKPVRLRLGMSDGVNTEVLSGDLQDDQDLIIGEARAGDEASADTQTRNPFMPQFPRGGNRGGQGGAGGRR